MSSTRRLRRRVVGASAAGVVGLLAIPAAPANAHAELIGSTPEDGATVARLPTEVSLEFSEPIATPAYVEVTAPDGAVVADGQPDVRDGTVSQQVTGDGPSGSYTVAYRVVSADGHPVSGELTFDVASGPAPVSDESATSADPVSNDGFLKQHGLQLAVVVGGVLVGGWLLTRASWRARP